MIKSSLSDPVRPIQTWDVWNFRPLLLSSPHPTYKPSCYYQFERLLPGPAASLRFTPSVYTERHSHSHRPSITSSSVSAFLDEGAPHLRSRLHSHSTPFIFLRHRTFYSKPAVHNAELLYNYKHNSLKGFSPRHLDGISLTLITKHLQTETVLVIKAKKLADKTSFGSLEKSEMGSLWDCASELDFASVWCTALQRWRELWFMRWTTPNLNPLQGPHREFRRLWCILRWRTRIDVSIL